MLVVKILDRRKLEIDHHDFVARAAKIKTGRNHRLREGDVLVQRNLTGLSAKERGDLVADADGHFPPALFPGAHAALGPAIRIGLHALVYAARHGTERIANHVGGALENRKLRAPLEKLVHEVILQG